MSTELPEKRPEQPPLAVQVAEVAQAVSGKAQLPQREAFFKALRMAIAENNKLKPKERSLTLGYYEALLETPAYQARYMKKPSQPLSGAQAQEEGEALVEAFVLARMPGLLPGTLAKPLPFDEKREEQYLIASELLTRKNTRNITGVPLMTRQETKAADGSNGQPTLEARSYNRRQFTTRAVLGGVALVGGVFAIRDGAKKELRAWMYSAAAPEQERRIQGLQKKLAEGKTLTQEDLESANMAHIRDEISSKATPDNDPAFNAAITKIILVGAAAVVGAGKLIWHLSAYKGNAADRSTHEMAKVMLNACRCMDAQTRAVYDSIPTPPPLLPQPEGPGAGVS